MAACDWPVEGELSAYLDGELPTARNEEVGGHLATCARCREDLAGLRVVKNTLEGLPQVEPPPHLAATIQRRLGEVRRRQRAVAERRRVLLPLVGTAAAILLVVFSLNFLGPALVHHVAGTVAVGEGAGSDLELAPGAGSGSEPTNGGQAGANPAVAPRETTGAFGAPGDSGAAPPEGAGGNSDSAGNEAGRPHAGAATGGGEASGEPGVAPGTASPAGGDGPEDAPTATGEATAAGVREQDQQDQPAIAGVMPVAHWAKANLILQVSDPETARDRIADIAVAAGGQVEDSYTATGPVSVLVPPDKFASTVEQVKAVGEPVAVTGEEPVNLSVQYQQALSKVQSLEREAASLRRQLESGQGTAYVRGRLIQVEQEKLAREQEVKNLENLFTWGVINVTLQDREPAAPGE